MKDSRVEVIKDKSFEEMYARMEEFIEGKIVIDISYEMMVEPISHKAVIVYQDVPDIEMEDVEFDDEDVEVNEDDIIYVDGYGEHLYLDPDDLI